MSVFLTSPWDNCLSGKTYLSTRVWIPDFGSFCRYRKALSPIPLLELRLASLAWGQAGVRFNLLGQLLVSMLFRSLAKNKVIYAFITITPYFTRVESNANEREQRVFLICTRLGSCEVWHLARALANYKPLMRS